MLKRLVPGYDAQRAAFAARFDQDISYSTAMLLERQHPPDSPPNVTEAELPDATKAREAMRDTWGQNVALVWIQWNTLPQQFTPQRQAMEDILLRHFAKMQNLMCQ